MNRRLVDDGHEKYHKCDNKEKIRFAVSVWVEISELSYRGGKYGYVHRSDSEPTWADQRIL